MSQSQNILKIEITKNIKMLIKNIYIYIHINNNYKSIILTTILIYYNYYILFNIKRLFSLFVMNSDLVLKLISKNVKTYI